jgi:hypothetical protein
VVYFKYTYLLKLVKGTVLLLVRVLAVYNFCLINLFFKKSEELLSVNIFSANGFAILRSADLLYSVCSIALLKIFR